MFPGIFPHLKQWLLHKQRQAPKSTPDHFYKINNYFSYQRQQFIPSRVSLLLSPRGNFLETSSILGDLIYFRSQSRVFVFARWNNCHNRLETKKLKRWRWLTCRERLEDLPRSIVLWLNFDRFAQSLQEISIKKSLLFASPNQHFAYTSAFATVSLVFCF